MIQLVDFGLDLRHNRDAALLAALRFGRASCSPKMASAFTSSALIKPPSCRPSHTRAPKAPATLRASRLLVRADPPAKEEEKVWTPPVLDPNTPSPIFGGSTGGLLRKAQVEEFYIITFDAKKEQIFEMPTGGAAIMRKGPNLVKLARKEQCLALTTQLRTKFKTDACFYRVFPSGEVQYLHPKDGVYPEKVNAGREGANQNMRSIGENVDPIQVKFTGKAGPFDV